MDLSVLANAVIPALCNSADCTDYIATCPNRDASVLANATIQALSCIGNSTQCVAICPNQDLAGIGVRIAFYLQSVLNALLVALSPTNSVPTAWASTLLTGSLIIAAVCMKASGNLTLYHATLVLNFATLSTISSLAVAPMLPIWRLTPGEYYQRERARHSLTPAENEGGGAQDNLIASEFYINAHKKQLKEAQKRARIVLALAIIIQVFLQWAWVIYLFVSPLYGQSECSGCTVLIMFLHPFTVGNINNVDHNKLFFVWPLWLLFNLTITFALIVVLALSSPTRARPELHSGTSAALGTTLSSGTPIIIALGRMAIQSLPPKKDKGRQCLFWGNSLTVLLWALLIVSSEWQKRANFVFPGEDSFGGFGQITAVFVALAPLWSLSVALYKYPALRRREERHRQRNAEQLANGLGRPESPALLRRPGHVPTPSEERYPDAQEMQSLMNDHLSSAANTVFPAPRIHGSSWTRRSAADSLDGEAISVGETLSAAQGSLTRRAAAASEGGRRRSDTTPALDMRASCQWMDRSYRVEPR